MSLDVLLDMQLHVVWLHNPLVELHVPLLEVPVLLPELPVPPPSRFEVLEVLEVLKAFEAFLVQEVRRRVLHRMPLDIGILFRLWQDPVSLVVV